MIRRITVQDPCGTEQRVESRGIDIIISGTDETSIDTQITSYNALSDEAKNVISRIDTHSYSGSNREGLKELAESEGKNLWMSEVTVLTQPERMLAR